MPEFGATLTFSASSTSGLTASYGFSAHTVRMLNRGPSQVYFRTDGNAASSGTSPLLLSSGEVFQNNIFPSTGVAFTTTATSTSALATVNLWALG